MSYYENHIFPKELPIIFHLDHLQKMEQCINNWHENLEFIYCIQGEGDVTINSTHMPLRPGTMIIINSGDIHYITSLSAKVSYYCLIISAAFLQEYGIDVEHTSFCECIYDDSCGAFFHKIVRELTEKHVYYQTVVKGEILSYVAELCRNYTEHKKNHVNNDCIKKGILYIREHFTETLNLEMIAAYAGFSRYYFSRKFKEITGLSVMKYVENLRCRYAKELLEKGVCVSTAALESGFTDVSYFTKVFKRQYGILPSACKKAVQFNR